MVIKNNTLTKVILILSLIAVATGLYFFQLYTQQKEIADLPEVFVSMTDTGFVPKTITIQKGQRVTWRTTGKNAHWPATDLHPTHSFYPKSSITKCGTEEEVYIFDSCKPIKEGESYSFIFEEEGEWKYHDHLQSRLLGEITVTK